MIFMFKGVLSWWKKIGDSNSFSKRGIFETKFDIVDKFFSWFSIWLISSSNFKLLNFMWWLYEDVTNDVDTEFVDLFNSYEELAKLYVELSYEDAKLSWDLRDLEELALLNPFIILLIVIENNHNLALNQFK